jgi:hypothetical protein
MVLVRMLQRLGMRADVDLVVLHLPVSSRVVNQMRAMGLTTNRGLAAAAYQSRIFQRLPCQTSYLSTNPI